MNAPEKLSSKQELAEVHRAFQRRLVKHVTAGRTTDMAEAPLSLPASIFTDPSRLEAERRELFLKLPLVAGLSTDIPTAGDTLLFDGAGPSIIIIRDHQGKTNAFLNMCTHRGTQLVKDCGKHETITCPFHGWSFDLQGHLVGQPGSEGFDGIDRQTLGLIRVPCAEAHGMIFVKAEPVTTLSGNESIDAEVADLLGDFGHQLALLEFDHYLPVKSSIMKSKGNWKYVAETYGEGYHFAALHPTSLGQTHFNNVAVYQRFGLHHNVCFALKQYKDYAAKPASEWQVLDSVMYSIFPNTQILIGSPQPGSVFVQLFRIYPTAVSGTEVHFTLYATEDVIAAAGREFVAGAFDLAAGIIENEDLTAATNAQRVLVHAPADFKVTYGRNEIALQVYQKNIAEAIGMSI